MDHPSCGADANEACDLEEGQVLGDGRLGHSREIRQGTNRLFAVADKALVDGSPRGIGERSEEIIRYSKHGLFITPWL